MFEITANEANSFNGKFWRAISIKGPNTLARFSDSARGDKGRLGRFWIYASELEEMLAHGPSGMDLVKEVSQRWAVCDDWGDKKLLSLMDIPAGFSIPAICGRAKAQPKVHDPAVRETRRSYAGESLQLIVPVIDTEYPPNVNQAFATLVRRKLTTLRLVTNPRFELENPWVAAQKRRGANI